MNHLDIDIKKADWLNESQKKKLIKVYNSIRTKDITGQALDVLRFNGLTDPTRYISPWHYKTAMISVLRLISLEGASEIIPRRELVEIGDIVESIYKFFDILDSDSFNTLSEVYDAYNYSNGNPDKKINELMKDLNIE